MFLEGGLVARSLIQLFKEVSGSKNDKLLRKLTVRPIGGYDCNSLRCVST